MNDVQFGLIHNWLLDVFKDQTYPFNDYSLAYLKKLKDAYDDFIFCVGQKKSLNEISKSYNVFYQMIDVRIMCLFDVAHRCKCILDTAINRKESYEEHEMEECFCILRDYMFKSLTLQKD